MDVPVLALTVGIHLGKIAAMYPQDPYGYDAQQPAQPYTGAPYGAASPQSPPPYSPAAPAPYAPPPQVVLVQPQRSTSGLAVTSLVLGIIGLVTGCCTFGIPSLIAVITGHVAIRTTRTNQQEGRGMAVAGLVMGYIMLAPAIALSVWIVFGAGLSALGVSSIDPTPTPTFP